MCPIYITLMIDSHLFNILLVLMHNMKLSTMCPNLKYEITPLTFM